MEALSDPDGDTIVAIATPPGTGALGIIRISGPAALTISDQSFRGRSLLQKVSSHTAHYGCIIQPTTVDSSRRISEETERYLCERSKLGKKLSRVMKNGSMEFDGFEVLDDVVATVFRSPASYTGEDTVEITCHGSNLVTATIVAVFLRNGARTAEPGEFTRRAFLNGKLDLTQAEAVSDVIRSSTAASLRGARNRLNGTLGTRISKLRQQLLGCSALVELELDFADEDIEIVSLEEISSKLGEVQLEIGFLLSTFRVGKVLRDGINVVIAGPPNVGKSSLMNQLLNEARALVTNVPGTTRDVLHEDLDINGIPVRLHDTAGLHATDDVVEQLGVARSIETVGDADLVLFVTAADQEFPQAIYDQVRAVAAASEVVVVANKIDLVVRPCLEPIVSLKVSAKTGEGMRELGDLIVDNTVGSAYSERSSLIASERHKENLNRAQSVLKRGQKAIESGIGHELVAADLRTAITSLEEIIGIIASDDVLNEIFSRFCIGK